MPVSPKTQALMQPPPTEEDATLAFEDGFSQLAHRIFSTKFPELMEYAVTFKVIKTDLDSNSGVGAFVLDISGETIFVPTILANNQIKPLEVMFVKDKDIFLPLTQEWIEEVSRGSLDSLGQGVEPPKTLSPDQDIRNVVVPPTVGRFAYASAQPSGVKLAQFLADAPNHVKEAFKLVLEKNHDILKYAFENFDKDMLLEALRPNVEKTASLEKPVTILTPENETSEFREMFGKKANTAWQEAVKKGYVIADTRKNVNRAVETEEPLKLTNVQENGFYWIHMQDGSRKRALVIVDPQPLRSKMEAGKRTDLTQRPDPYRQERKKRRDQLLEGEEENRDKPGESHQSWLLYFDNGNIVTAHQSPVGEIIPVEDISGGLLAKLKKDEAPISSGYGVFLCFRGGKFSGTVPTEIESVSTGSDGVRRAKTFGDGVLVTDSKDPIKQIVAPKDSNVTYIPTTYKFVRGSREYNARLLEGAEDTLTHIENLQKTGALKVKLIDAGAGMFSVGGLESLDKLGTVTALVAGLELRQDCAEDLLKKASTKGHTSFYVVNDSQLRKFAEMTKEAQGMPPLPAPGGMPAPQGAMPMGGPPEGVPMEGGMPPEMAIPPEMAPEMAPPMPPEPPLPNPVELAVDEIGAEVADQSEAVAQQLAEEQRELGNKMNILQAVKDRAMQIAGEISGETPPGAEPPGAPEQVPPEVPMGPGEEAPPPGPAGAMPPEAGGMPPPGPEAMPPEAGAMPPPQGPGAMEMANSAEPMMADAAGVAEKLKSPETFEATAIGAMAADSDLRSSVTDYMPTLEEALDNLGRILFTFWLEEDKLRKEMGEEDFGDLESQLLTVFNNLGDLVLKINRTAMPVKSQDEEVA